MGDKTRISWADATWNPVVGCARISEGCKNCYALKLQNRRYKANARHAMVYSGLHEDGERKLRHYESWPTYVERVGPPAGGWPARARHLGIGLPLPAQYDKPFSQVQLLPDRLDQPLHWRKPRRIFMCSMADLFHPAVPDEFIDRVFGAMLRAKRRGHTFLILTKRPERMRWFVTEYWPSVACLDLRSAPFEEQYSHVHLGVSVENQHWAAIRIPVVLDTPAAVRWISAEPLLAPLDLRPWIGDYMTTPVGQGVLRWVVVGGESGPGFREMNPQWALDIKRQCDDAGVAFFFKQAAGPRPGMPSGIPELDNAKALV